MPCHQPLDQSASRHAQNDHTAAALQQACRHLAGAGAKSARQVPERKVQAKLGADERANLDSEVRSADQTSTKTLFYVNNKKALETDSESTSHLQKSQRDICHELLTAMAHGEGLTIAASEMPKASVSEDARHALAALWANDIARAEARLPLRTPDTTEDTPHVPKQAATPSLPGFIPEADKYKPRQGIVEFLESGWPAPFVKAKALSRPDFRRLDPEGEMALRNWLRNPANTLPAHLEVPTKAELNDRMLEGTDPEQLRHAARLHRAQSRRQTGIPTR